MRTHLSLSLFALLFASCATPRLSPDLLTVREESYGRYTRAGADLEHLETTTTIDCQLGQTFGMQVELDFTTKYNAVLPFQVEAETDIGPGRSKSVLRFPEKPIKAPADSKRIGFEVTETLEDKDLVDSNHTIRLFDPKSERTYLKRTFEIRGCP